MPLDPIASDLGLGIILNAINLLRTQVDTLSTRLDIVEKNVSNLQATVCTPSASPSSPNKSSSESSLGARVAETVEESPATNPPVLQTDIQKEHFSSAASEHAAPSQGGGRACHGNCGSCEQPSELQRQLQPISEGIGNLMKHVLHIENAITQSNLGPNKSPNAVLNHDPHLPTQPIRGTQNTPQPASQDEPPRPAKYVRTPRTPTHTLPDHARPIFGQPSIPTLCRQSPLNVTGSPFGNYVDERSPFSVLRKKNTGQTGFGTTVPLLKG